MSLDRIKKALKIVEVLATHGYEDLAKEETLEDIHRVTKYKITKDELLESLKDLSELVERATPAKPKQPITKPSLEYWWICPNCKDDLFGKYCKNCGKKIDWSK